MTLPVSNPVRADSRAGYAWVVWQLEVIDPEHRISEPYASDNMPFLLAEYSRDAVADLAARRGLVYEGCWEGSWGSDDDPCYRWWFRVPHIRHGQRSSRGWPVAVEECRQALDRLFCDNHHWYVKVDKDRTGALKAGEQELLPG
ncbi:hypothetical protein [Streptomyces sp. NPDC056672]|uniref:hypothetical protein n=1 Tax=Streptomyces sp. NPDC056672 TaxID=3345906 RepID=UPI0036C5373C